MCRVEARRDDPLVDTMLTDLEQHADRTTGTPPPANDIRPPEAPRPDLPPAMPRAELEREARRFLRRLSEPGSFLLVTPDASKGGIFCKANEHTKPIAMLPVSIAVEFVREGWIRVFQRGAASIRYRIAQDGRSYLKRLLSEDALKRQPGTGFAEAATPFLAQHQLPGERSVKDPTTGKNQTMRVNLGEEPLGWLSRRKGPDGQPFLTLVGTDRVVIVVTTILLVGALYLFFGRTRVGIAMQASSQNQLAAYYMGIPVKRLVSLTWAMGAMIAACAGALLAPVTQVDTTIGLLGIKALAGAIVGGFGSIPGALLGCILIGVVEPFADYYLPGIKGVSAYVVMLVVLFVRPEGLIVQTYQKKV